jgi:hypothetical protein
MTTLEEQVASQTVINGLAGPDLFGERGLHQGQIKVPLMFEAVEKAGRFFESFPDVVLGDTVSRGSLDDDVTVNAPIAEPAS